MVIFATSNSTERLSKPLLSRFTIFKFQNLLFGRLTDNATIHPITNGMLAMNPQRRDSNIVCGILVTTKLWFDFDTFIVGAR